jgi:glycerate kinase
MKTVLAAFDKFRGSLTAQQACEIAGNAVREYFPEAKVLFAPLTDGGEGFCEILTNAAQGVLIEVRTLDSRFTEKPAHFGVVSMDNLTPKIREMLELPDSARKIAIVEMAQASDLASIPEDHRDPWSASSAGTGLLIREAANLAVDAILLGIGGSATNDLGLGALEALGTEFIDRDGVPVLRLTDIFSNQLPLPPIRIACDVNNPLLGERGATRIFALQKGLPESDFCPMEDSLEKAARLLCDATGKDMGCLKIPGAGAAGGIGLGLHMVYDARFLPGFELVSHWLELPQRISEADLILTGEGSFDKSSLDGKGPWSLVHQGVKAGNAVWVFAGQCTSGISEYLPNGVSLHCITPEGLSLPEAFRKAPVLLHNCILNRLQML